MCAGSIPPYPSVVLLRGMADILLIALTAAASPLIDAAKSLNDRMPTTEGTPVAAESKEDKNTGSVASAKDPAQNDGEKKPSKRPAEKSDAKEAVPKRRTGKSSQ